MFRLPLKGRYSIPLFVVCLFRTNIPFHCLSSCLLLNEKYSIPLFVHCLSFHLPLEKQIFHSVVCLSICFLITNIQFHCLSLCLSLEKQIFHSILRLPICFVRTIIPFHYLHFHLLHEDKSSIPLFAFSSASRGQIFHSIVRPYGQIFCFHLCVDVWISRLNLFVFNIYLLK